jgi:subtilase family serine protease
MNISKISKLLLAAASALLSGQSIYAQSVGVAVMPGPTASGFARSHAWMVMSTDGSSPAVMHGPGQPSSSCIPSVGPCYYFPSDIVSAYAINSIANGNGGAGMTVAIVDAYYNSQTESDLGTYSSNFGLPTCTISNGCLSIVNQNGGTDLSGVNFNLGWAQETDLDVQTVHAIAPKAKILLIACNSNSFTDLGTGVLYAQAHANVVTNSYGANEFAGETSLDTYYSSSTVPILFSSGDTGAVTEYPCTSSYALCVGGTRLLETATSFRNVESAWGGVTTSGGGGGGCSSQVGAPAFQAGFSTCGNARGVPDVAALADEYTGFVVYLGTNAGSGVAAGYVFGGTSLASPLTAAVIAVIDTARAAASKAPLGANLNALLYQAAVSPYYRYRLYDVTTGSTGFAAGTGWDKADGLGVILGPSMASYFLSFP